MAGMDGWDITLLVVASYIAVVSLTRLMRHRSTEVTNEWHKKIEEDRMLQEAQQSVQRFHEARESNPDNNQEAA